MKNQAAQALGRRGRGVAKQYSPEEIATRTKRLAQARKKRWPPIQRKCACGKPVGESVGDGVCLDCRFASRQ